MLRNRVKAAKKSYFQSRIVNIKYKPTKLCSTIKQMIREKKSTPSSTLLFGNCNSSTIAEKIFIGSKEEIIGVFDPDASADNQQMHVVVEFHTFHMVSMNDLK